MSDMTGDATADTSLDADKAFMRALMSQVRAVDASFAREHRSLAQRIADVVSSDTVDPHEVESCQQLVSELNRYSLINFLCVMKIVKKHDKNSAFSELRAEVGTYAIRRARWSSAPHGRAAPCASRHTLRTTSRRTVQATMLCKPQFCACHLTVEVIILSKPPYCSA